MTDRITNQHELRRTFWEHHPDLDKRRKVQFGTGRKQHVADTRCAFVDWIDLLCREGTISTELASRATL